MHFFTSSQCFWMVLTLQHLKLGGNLDFSWYSCNILRYCSNRCIVWFYIPKNCPAHANRKFPVQLYIKIHHSLWAAILNMQMSKSPIISGYHLFLRNSRRKSDVGKMNGTVITNRLQNSFKIKDNNVYGSLYYWNFRTSSFKQVACFILTKIDTSFHQRSLISVFRIWFNVYLLTSYMTRFG
jgi:hypothetical protein